MVLDDVTHSVKKEQRALNPVAGHKGVAIAWTFRSLSTWIMTGLEEMS